MYFFLVNGQVFIDDRVRGQSRMATQGLRIDLPGEYLVATAANSTASIMIDGELFKLSPSSWLYVHGSKNCSTTHCEHLHNAQYLKHAMGKLWAMVDRLKSDDKWDEGGGGGGGIRG